MDTTLNVTAIPPNLPTIVTIGWNTDYETKFRVEGTSGTNSSNYALTGITKIAGFEGNLPENLAVNCLNNEDFFNQYSSAILTAAGLNALLFVEDTASDDDYLAAVDPFPDTYDEVEGVPLSFKPNTSNTGAATLDINSMGEVDIKKYSSGVLADLSTGDLIADNIYIIVWDGTQFLLMNPSNSSGTSADWTAYTAVTPTTGTFDAPSFPIVFAGVDLTAVLKPGMRVKITQATDKFFIITKVAFSTDTTVTLYGGTDYTLVSSGTTAISAFSYSTAKVPLGFNVDPLKWTQEYALAGTAQNSPTQNTWYNIGGSLAIPIGAWNVTFQGTYYAVKSSTVVSVYSTLSTANNSESDVEWSSVSFTRADNNGSTPLYTGGSWHKSKNLLLASKTTYYGNARTTVASVTAIGLSDADSGTSKVVIRAVCAYL